MPAIDLPAHGLEFTRRRRDNGLAGAVLAKQTDEGAESRRYLGLDVLVRSPMRVVPDTGTEVNTDTIMALSA